MTITETDLHTAVPLPQMPSPSAVFLDPSSASFGQDAAGRPGAPRTNRLAIASLVLAVAGIPLFGLLTGLVAIVLGSLALGAIRTTRQRGTGLAVVGVILGMGDMIGWMIFLAVTLSQPHRALDIDNFEPDVAAFENLVPHIRRAMKANAWIETEHRAGVPLGIGSGVVLQMEDGNALIVTNRHVVDPGFDAEAPNQAAGEMSSDHLGVRLIGEPVRPGRVVWMAPDGIDLALVRVPVSSDQVEAAKYLPTPRLAVGQDVFAIGNPQGLGWTHTGGVISQFRRQKQSGRDLRIIQTSTAINPGNSGGGLYDAGGTLIGINTWTNDKRFSEGLSFAIDFEELLHLAPPPLILDNPTDDTGPDVP